MREEADGRSTGSRDEGSGEEVGDHTIYFIERRKVVTISKPFIERRTVITISFIDER